MILTFRYVFFRKRVQSLVMMMLTNGDNYILALNSLRSYSFDPSPPGFGSISFQLFILLSLFLLTIINLLYYVEPLLDDLLTLISQILSCTLLRWCGTLYRMQCLSVMILMIGLGTLYIRWNRRFTISIPGIYGTMHTSLLVFHRIDGRKLTAIG